MNLELPHVIATYFEKKGSDSPSETLACFAPDATVVDSGENREMVGHEAIGEWLSGTVAEYNLSTELLRSVEVDGETVVTASVSGNFPGSPIEFDYHFVVEGGKIQRLVIR